MTKVRTLLSYWYAKPMKTFEKLRPFKLFMDSGAFSAAVQGGSISVDEYGAFLLEILENESFVEVYSNLDVIGNHAATIANQERLEGLGLSPLPVFHFGGRFEDLEAYCERYPYVALGGMVPVSSTDLLLRWCDRCFLIAAKHGAVFHGFGCTRWKILAALPWYSVDSTSWAQGYRYGSCPVFDERKGRFFKVDLGGGWTTPRASLLEQYGYDLRDFTRRDRNTVALTAGLGAASYIRAQNFLRSRHGVVRCEGRDGGLLLYLADTHVEKYEYAAAGIERERAHQLGQPGEAQ